MSDVAVIVVTHDSAHELEGCVASVLAHRGDADVDIAVCDSGSRDDVEAVAARLPVRFLPGPNLGFGAACNRGLAAYAPTSARYVLFLNPDVRVVGGTISHLVAECDCRPGIGVATARLVDQYGSLIRNMGRPSTPLEYWRLVLLGGSELEWTSSRYDDEQACAWVEGSFLFARRDTIEQVGGFDERFFLYSEETDWCLRLRRAGWDVRHLPQLEIVHHQGGYAQPELAAQLAFSKLLFARKHYGRVRTGAIQGALALRHLLRAPLFTALSIPRPRWRARAHGERRALSIALGLGAKPRLAPAADLNLEPRA